MADISQRPYFDDYDAQKQFTHMMAVPGRVEQAREATQVQTMIFDFLKRLSDTLLRDGSIVTGMGFVQNKNDITVEDGTVYLQGKVHVYNTQTVKITGTGTDRIGILLKDSIITEEQDTSLRDPAHTKNSGQPGMHRIKSEPYLVVNNEDAPTILEFEDGQLKLEPARPQFDQINEVLARRTYDESGNYRVSGFELNVDPYNANDVQLTVDVGTAYVMGYEVRKPVPVKRFLNISKDTRLVQNEPKTYQNGQANYALNRFPASKIVRVMALLEATQNVTRGGTLGGRDVLQNRPVMSIQSVVQGGKTYVNGRDFVLTEDTVDWGFDGDEPASGSTYTVVYRYNRNLANGSDYDLYQETGRWGETKDYIRFLKQNVRPVNGSPFYVDYEFFLARYDLVSLDPRGNIVITKGQPDNLSTVRIPINEDPSLLHLGYVLMPPNSGNAKTTNRTVTRLVQSRLQRMMERLEDVEYNQAITALDQEAMEGELPTNLKGVFSDSFRSTVRADMDHPDFDVMYSLEDGTIMLPTEAIKDRRPEINSSSNAKVWGRLITAPMKEVVAVNQHLSTTSMKINPYLAFNAMGLLRLDPAVDNWIETDYIRIEENVTEARRFDRWWRHLNQPWRHEKHEDIMDWEMENGGTVGDWRGAIGDTGVAYNTEKSTSIMEEAITNMRQIEVTIDATNLSPSTDNLRCSFDNVNVALTPLAGYQSGSNPGTVRSNASGRVRAKFRIPAGIRTGTREVILYNDSNTASAPYTAIGTKQTTVDKIINTRVILTAFDPLAQTFQFPQDTCLTSFGVYFSAKDNIHNVQVQVRNVVNGYPGTTLFEEVTLTPSQIRVSEDASIETKVTFNDPVMCNANTQYCVVYLTDSDVTALHVAKLGDRDVYTGQTVTRNPYLAGVLFSSSNGLSWTAHQDMDMKFKAYVAEFQPTGTVEFDPMQNLESDKLLLLADHLTPRNTGCIWDMKLNDGDWIPITSYNEVDLDIIADKVQLRATFKSDKNMSPLMAKDSFTFIGFLQAKEGSYISRNTELFEDLRYVKQSFDAFIPQGCSVEPQFSYDNGKTWKTPTRSGDGRQVSRDWTNFVFEAEVPASAQARNFRSRLNIKASSSVVRPKARKFINIMR